MQPRQYQRQLIIIHGWGGTYIEAPDEEEFAL